MVDLYFAIHESLLTSINSPKLVGLLEFKDSMLVEYNYHKKTMLVERIVKEDLHESHP
jgi:hypothetical protein